MTTGRFKRIVLGFGVTATVLALLAVGMVNRPRVQAQEPLRFAFRWTK